MANRGLIRSGGTAKKWKPMTSVGVKRNLAMSGKLNCYFHVLGIKMQSLCLPRLYHILILFGLGPNNDNRIQDVSRAIEYLQNLQYELLSEDADILDKSMPADNNERR